MDLLVEKLVAKYRAVSQFPSLNGARILKKCGTPVIITSFWSQRCLERSKISKFVQTHLVCEKNVHTPPVDTSSELMSAISPSGSLRAVLREATSSEGGSKKLHMEVWSDNQLSQVVDLTLLDQHGDVYTSGEFSCLEWSPCEQKLLYVAEKKQPKAEPFYPTKPKDKDSNISEDKLSIKGEEYIFRQDWGETLAGKHHPVLCVCDLASGTVTVPAGVPDTMSAGQALWMDDSIVGVVWPHTPRRLGIVHCSNRLSYIFHLTNDGTFTKLSGEGLAAHSVRLSPNKEYLVWLQRPANGPHDACHQLVKQVWGALPHLLVDIVQTYKECESGHKFHGLYCNSLPLRCFSDNKTLLLSSLQQSAVCSYIVNTESGGVKQLEHSSGSLTVLDVCGDIAVCGQSSVDTPAHLLLCHLYANVSFTPVTQSRPLSPLVPGLKQHIFHLSANIQDAVMEYNAIYYGPTEGKEHSVPLIVWPHGGPHTSYVDSYSGVKQFFISAGFATLQVNFRGSTGQGQASVDFLPGRVGNTDVKDCHQAALEALQTFTCLDPKQVVLYGGSHGGFLVAHLSGQYPEFYKAVVAVNPVTDLVSMACVTDIPDWAVVEGGFIPYTGKEQVEMPPDFLAKLWDVSPIKYASKVKAPTLLNIGKKDLRVPPSQGTHYYHTLNTYNITCKMNLYDDSHSLATVPVDLDATINTVLWFQKHLGTNSD